MQRQSHRHAGEYGSEIEYLRIKYMRCDIVFVIWKIIYTQTVNT